MVLHPDEEADLLQDSRFIDVGQYGSREPIWNGEIGKIAGMKVLVTTQIPAGFVLYLEPRTCGKLVWKRDLDIMKKHYPEYDSYRFYAYAMFAPKVIIDEATAISVNHEVDSASLTV